MFRHPYVLLALGAVFVVLSATVAFSPSASQGGRSASTSVTALTDVNPSAANADDRAEAVRIFHEQ